MMDLRQYYYIECEDLVRPQRKRLFIYKKKDKIYIENVNGGEKKRQ